MSETAIEARLAEAMAWGSLGLGVALVGGPSRIARLAGIEEGPGSRKWLRIVGLRELGAFALIKAAQPRPRAALWARLAGDAQDLALLGVAMRGRRTRAPRLIATTAGTAAIAALDLFT